MHRSSKTLLAGMGGLCFIMGAAATMMKQVDAKSLPANCYTVQPSDTLWGISRAYGTTVARIKAFNSLRTNTIYVGERLNLPERPASQSARMATGHPGFSVKPHIPGLPARLIPVYKAAAQPYRVPWTILAAIHKIETDFAISHCPVSNAGAQGPFQFMPSTFRAYAVNVSGHHGTPSIQNVGDAAATAAHMLAEDGFAKNPRAAIYDYNHSNAYVHQILELAGFNTMGRA